MDHDSPESQLAVTQAMADALDDYLAGDTLYHNMAVQTPAGLEHPVMTLGALLERVEALRSSAAGLTAAQRQQLAAGEEKLAHSRRARPEQWQAGLRRELKALLDSWKWYLDDAAAGQRARDNYRAEAHNRTRIDLLLREVGADPAAADFRLRVAELDARLRAMWQPGPYIGPRGGEARYPATTAWWLYGRPAGQDA